MRVRTDRLDVVIVEGLPEGAIFCGPVTAEVIAGRLSTVEKPATDHGKGPDAPAFISDVRRALMALIGQMRAHADDERDQ